MQRWPRRWWDEPTLPGHARARPRASTPAVAQFLEGRRGPIAWIAGTSPAMTSEVVTNGSFDLTDAMASTHKDSSTWEQQVLPVFRALPRRRHAAVSGAERAGADRAHGRAEGGGDRGWAAGCDADGSDGKVRPPCPSCGRSICRHPRRAVAQFLEGRRGPVTWMAGTSPAR